MTTAADTLLDTAPPRADESERVLLGAVLGWGREALALAEQHGVGPASFFDEEYQRFFALLQALADKVGPSGSFDITMVAVELQRDAPDLFDVLGGVDGLIALSDEVTGLATLPYHVRMVATAARGRAVRDLAASVLRAAGQLMANPVQIAADAAARFEAIAKADGDPDSGLFVRLSDVAPQPVRWVWHRRVALGKLTIAAGHPGLGKSCVTLDVAARVTRGDGFPDCPSATSKPGGVILLSAEDDLSDTVRPRLDAAGADVSRVLALTTARRFDPELGRDVFAPFDLAVHLPLLESGIDRVPNCRLIIIDPISAYLGAVDSHNNSQVRGLLAPLADLAARRGVAVVAVSHLNKGGGDALSRVMGSVGFVAAARAVYAVVKDQADPSRRLFLPCKNNLGVDDSGLAYRLMPAGQDAVRVVWEDGAVTLPADDALAPAEHRRGPEPEDRQEAQTWLADFLRSGPQAAEECLTEGGRVGITRATLRRAKAAAGIVAEKQGFGGPWQWRLPASEVPF